ncbi:MAG: hypothetical protein R2838_14070 [Caldilineaceae bacterium]
MTGWDSAVLEPVMSTQSASRTSLMELVKAPLPKAMPRPVTVLA